MASDALLHAAWAVVPEPILVVDEAKRIRAANPALAALLGLDAQLLEGRPLASLLVAEDAECLARAAEAAPGRCLVTLAGAEGRRVPAEVGIGPAQRFEGGHLRVLSLRATGAGDPPQALQRRIFDAIDSGVVWYDAQARLVDANRSARRVLGLGDGPLAARSDDLGWQQFDEQGEPLPLERRPVWRALHGRQPSVSAVVVVDTPRGGRRWLRVNALAVGDLGGGLGPGAVALFTDFTEQHHAMRSLRESEQLFRMFGDNAMDILWIVDPREQKLVYVNAAYERIFGRPREPLYEQLSHWLDGCEPEDYERVANAAFVQGPKGNYEVEYRMTRPDGRHVWIRGRGFPLHDADGRMRYMAGFAEDVSLARESEALQAAHRRAQERLERIAATAPGAMHSYRQGPDGRGAFTFASPAIEELFGVSPAALVDGGVGLLDVVHAEDRPLLMASLARSAAEGSEWLATFRAPRARGGERWIEAHSMPVTEADGAVVWHGFFIDITERRRAEEALGRLNAELEARVAERTGELEAKHREMEAFTYSVSHDLKAPLRGIEGYSRLLESDHAPHLDSEGRLFVEMIRKAARQMGQLIDDLLAYSRLERGRPSLVTLAPAELVEALAAAHRGDVEAGGGTLDVAVDRALEVRGEREGLAMALRNLLENAIKFSAGAAARAIEIGVRREGSHGLLWVRDNGPGFDMRYHDRIFEIFQRLHRAEDFPGTGVGLAMVRKAVERMHGRVWARSAPGEGATFYIELPLA
jgi:PAS domain S-box-containing protein